MKIKGSWLGFALLAAAFALPLTGCDDDEFDHDPPPGKGTLYVVNKTGDGMDVYINGERVKGVGRGDKHYYDLDPNVHRVALKADDSDRSFAGDVDILEGRRTIMDVTTDLGDYRRFDVYIYFD
ncbi:MAG: hypothetical protein BWY59_01596 [Verrucomicrobia bacterium ADurb.Bin345]|nr:MAG: hypothetical protein BWY59_01596 [Verrucomicrobia bacterium ADurb.Bin345]